MKTQPTNRRRAGSKPQPRESGPTSEVSVHALNGAAGDAVPGGTRDATGHLAPGGAHDTAGGAAGGATISPTGGSTVVSAPGGATIGAPQYTRPFDIQDLRRLIENYLPASDVADVER